GCWWGSKWRGSVERSLASSSCQEPSSTRRSMYSWAEMRRWCPQLGHTFSARTNRSLMSMCPHSSHFSQASAGISSLTRSDVRGLRSFLNQAIPRHPQGLADVGEQQAGDPEDAQAGIRIGGTPGDPEQDQNQRHEEYQRYHHAHEPELLSDHRKDEIGVLRGQECESLLRAVGEPLAQEAARTDGDLRLDDVPTGRAGVHLGV